MSTPSNAGMSYSETQQVPSSAARCYVMQRSTVSAMLVVIYVTFLLLPSLSQASPPIDRRAIALHLNLALEHRATTYGWGEKMCGDVGKPRPCTRGAVTASGEPFRPHRVPSAAVPAPTTKRIQPRWIGLRLQGVPDAPCVAVRLNDKANPRWIGQRGLDLSPAAVQALTQNLPMPYWSGKVEECIP
jgi:hypothetical protein